ncbi:hypothetical protein PR202_ga29967 [Eleusine coracana subsp. coracana]|uniref:Transposase n=1 Tax=Eleusine coracana subsp. coracana TaxID=191504 RepID=A0AAV5DNJ8_ELECO|nr:hypothetical protein PR202_ga29967 [Eleusine coracana subsp. coracana]
MEELKRLENGKEVRYGARCNFCQHQLSAFSNKGTGHLLCHIQSCKRKALATSSSSQSQLHLSSDGHVSHFHYDVVVARTELVRMIAQLDMPLNTGEQPAFQDYIRIAHNPGYKGVSRQATTRDLEKYFALKQTAMIDLLKQATCVCLTSDIWSGNAKEHYLSVVFHFVTDDWELEKRIVGIRLIDCSHSGVNIVERILAVVSKYDMTSKTFSITLDNASANASTVNQLASHLSSYIGPFKSACVDACSSANANVAATAANVAESFTVFGLLHQRCACHIINLIVKSGLKRIKKYRENFRTATSWLNSSNQRIASFKSFCIASGARPRKFGLDMDVRWNATYVMLQHLVPYKETFSVFVCANYQ